MKKISIISLLSVALLGLSGCAVAPYQVATEYSPNTYNNGYNANGTVVYQSTPVYRSYYTPYYDPFYYPQPYISVFPSFTYRHYEGRRDYYRGHDNRSHEHHR
jgi:hypothetical protein